MKYLKLLPILLLFACQDKGLSDYDKNLIQINLDLLLINSHHDFAIDSLREVSKFKEKHDKPIYPDKLKRDHLKSHMAVFANEWNKPYKLEKDRFITVESYVEYCKAYKYDPVDYLAVLNK